jgi:hypothetical protein
LCARFLYHYNMFVRFRRQANRLQASLIETSRANGKVVAEHIGTLGSVDAAMSVRERLAFWAKLPERLTRLGNRVGPDEHAKIYGALHARIPMVTVEEQRAVQEANAEGDGRFWEAMRDMGTASVEEHKALISAAEARIAEQTPKAAKAGERAQAAKDRLDRIRRGESVPGGLGKPFDVRAALKAEGFFERDLRRMRLLASLTEAEMRQASAKAGAEVVGAADRAIKREARRIIRARRETARQLLNDEERKMLRAMEHDLGRPLTEREEHLSLEQARSLGMV